MNLHENSLGFRVGPAELVGIPPCRFPPPCPCSPSQAPRPNPTQITAASPSAGPPSAPVARPLSSGAIQRIGERMLRGNVYLLDKISFTIGVANVA